MLLPDVEVARDSWRNTSAATESVLKFFILAFGKRETERLLDQDRGSSLL